MENSLIKYQAKNVTVPPFLKKEESLNSLYSFTNFIIGPSNRLAVAAAKAICNQLTVKYTPLYIYSAIGMGKTHLLQAIYQTVKQKYPEKKIHYVTGDTFLQNLAYKELIDKYLNLEVLIVDGLQYLVDYPQQQHNFFKLFNLLHNQQKQLIFSSDCSPQNINGLSNSLISRLKWGLVVNLGLPSLKMKKALIKKKILYFNLNISDEIQNFLAENINNNIREIESILLKLTSYSDLLQTTIDLNITKHILNDYRVINKKKYISIEAVKKSVSDMFEISLEQLISKKRSRSLVLPRHISMYLIRNLTQISLAEVGITFSNRDHSTVKYACDNIEKRLKFDPGLNSTINLLKNKLLYHC